MKNISRSLVDLLGKEYMNAVKSVAVTLYGLDEKEADRLINEKVDFFPEEFAKKADALALRTGEKIVEGFEDTLVGAPTNSFRAATHLNAAPLGGLGCCRIGEDGKVYLAAKSEHYHIPMGHNFPGYKLLTNARLLGIPNATHNNTRGYITRLCERTIVAYANGTKTEEELDAVLASKEKGVLNRIINLETGSLACEAAIKMMLGRFYRVEVTCDTPKYDGKIPVFLVMEDNKEGFTANYHGTTIFAQTLRGMWPEFYNKCRENELYRIVSVKKNDLQDFADKIKLYNSGKYKTAGFLHEIIMMNYSGIRLTEEFLQGAHKLCHESDTFILTDEIQSCMWYDELFLFKKYKLQPDFVSIGKGFPGGEYAASKVLTTYEADSLSQFGALVTNGQEELASLAYLITMEFAKENSEEIERMGKKVEKALADASAKYPEMLDRPEGQGHLSAIHFKDIKKAADFTKIMNDKCIDISAQLYKADCPPAVLLKLPLITTDAILDFFVQKLKEGLDSLK